MTNENYRPANIEFNVMHDGSIMPETFGEFKNAEDASKFIGSGLVAINQGLTVARHMDFKEKTELRNEYNDVLENKLPLAEKDLTTATQELAEAKRKASDAQSTVDACIIQVKALATEVKRGLKEMNLDENYTHRIAFKNRYYFYTYMDKQLKLCKIQDVPEREKNEIFNQMAENELFINDKFNNVEVKE